MKKLYNYILFIIMALFITIMPTSARKVNVATLGDLVLKEEASSRAFYVIGKYVFTDVYVKNNSLNIEDIMLAARSIKLLSSDGETNTSEAYKKMNIYTVSLFQDGWKFNNNLIGSTKPQDDMLMDIKYIDYNLIKDVYTVTFEKDNNEAVTTVEVEYDTTISQPEDPTKKDYEFLGWFKCINEDCSTLEDDTFDFDTHIKEDIKLKAKWEELKYIVTFKGLEEDKIFEVKYSNPHIMEEELPDTTKEGKKFKGWYMCTNDECTETAVLSFDFKTNNIQKNCTFIAKWEDATYNVIFKTDDKKIYETKYVLHDNKVEAASEPHKHDASTYNGYQFIGWYECTDVECNATSETVFDFENINITKNLVLIAKYQEVVYTNKIMADFTENIDSNDFSSLVTDKSNIEFTILSDGIVLSKNFEKFVAELQNILKIENVNKLQITYNDSTILDLTKETNISEEFKKVFEALTTKDFDSSTISDLDGKQFTITICLDDNAKNNVDNDTTDVYNVSFSTNYAPVRNENELTNALKGDRAIIILNSFEVSNMLEINKAISIDGRNYTITSNINTSKYLFKINSGSISMKDLILKIDTLKPSEFTKETGVSNNTNKNTIGIYVGENAILTITNVQVKNKNVIDREALKLENEELHMNNVVLNQNAAVELHGELNGSGLTYENELYGSPTILMKSGSEKAKMNLGGIHRQDRIYNVKRDDRGDSYTQNTDFVHFYHDDKNSSIIYSWYLPGSGYFVSIGYLYGEHFIIPEVFTNESDKYGSYTENGKKYKFNDHWYIRDDKNSEYVSSEQLKAKKAEKMITYHISAQYNTTD